jgi:hypothetical protein
MESRHRILGTHLNEGTFLCGAPFCCGASVPPLLAGSRLGPCIVIGPVHGLHIIWIQPEPIQIEIWVLTHGLFTLLLYV